MIVRWQDFARNGWHEVRLSDGFIYCGYCTIKGDWIKIDVVQMYNNIARMWVEYNKVIITRIEEVEEWR